MPVRGELLHLPLKPQCPSVTVTVTVTELVLASTVDFKMFPDNTGIVVVDTQIHNMQSCLPCSRVVACCS